MRPRRLDDAALRLAVFHHAGGSAAAYFPLARELPADWDALLIDLPGRGTRHATPPPWDVGSVVEGLAEDLLPWADAAPLALFGHSLGAVVAFETARSLEERGVPVTWAGVSGRVAPGGRVTVDRLDPRAPDEELARTLARLGGLPERLAEYPDIRRRFLRLIRADLTALDGYHPDDHRRPLAAPLTAFGGAADPLAPPAALAAWARETTGRFGLRTLGGGHFGLLAGGFKEFTHVLVDEVRAHVPAPRSVVPASVQSR
ncbi:thioesterase II family protein [Streptomyces rapamycinicus]|nr:alpha/beta fold hydrolase [Streptomyces rapamycinicus]MBB4781064.1 surfactin synthase thioesterase subunit [Streptomyces rapamycinicus]UTO61724.1 alpha/beta fold hydrolase [Streptomyces rapamycinicus]UTP29677.1 alpha/beta fold hydrolase [Streptomyces rapamycinicus NRRL 5491]